MLISFNKPVYLFTYFNKISCSNTCFMTDNTPTDIKKYGKWIKLSTCELFNNIEDSEKYIINNIPIENIVDEDKPLQLYFITHLNFNNKYINPDANIFYTTKLSNNINHYILDNVLAFSFDDAKNKLLFYLSERHSKNSAFRIMMDCCFYLEYLGKFNNYIDTILFLLIHYLLRNHFNPESIDYIYKNYVYINRNFNTPDFNYFFEFNLY